MLNTHKIHKLEDTVEAEVTGFVCLQSNKILAVSWSWNITQYNIADSNVRGIIFLWHLQDSTFEIYLLFIIYWNHT